MLRAKIQQLLASPHKERHRLQLYFQCQNEMATCTCTRTSSLNSRQVKKKEIETGKYKVNMFFKCSAILLFIKIVFLVLVLLPHKTNQFSCTDLSIQKQVVVRLGSFSKRSFLQPYFKHVNVQQNKNQYSTRATLRMHMGHSHNHHVHLHAPLDSQSSPASGKVRKQSILIRRYAMLLFCALITLVRPVLSKGFKSLRISDWITFSIAAVGCRYFLEPLRTEIKHSIERIQNMGNGIAKHAPPLSGKMFSISRLLLSPSEDKIGSGGISYRNEAADRVTILGGFMNIVLSAAKLIIGVTCHSSALIADAGHSLSDLFSDFITLWAVQVGRLPPDDDHPYGHGKFEAIGALFLALTLLGTGLSVGIMSYKMLVEIVSIQATASTVSAIPPPIPTFPALIMAAISIVSKEWLFRVTRTVGERINSQVVIANAWHHRSDAYSSILALFSIGLAMVGLLAADAAAGILVAGMICMTGAEILGESVKQLTDTTDEKLVRAVTNIAANYQDVEHVHRVRARQVGSSSVIDVSVSIPERISSVSEVRAIEERLRKRILQEDGVLDVDVRALTPNANTIMNSQRLEFEAENSSFDSDFCKTATLTTSEEGPMISKAEIEALVRQEILEHHPEISSVVGVRVHYQDVMTMPINVDVDICLHDYNSQERTMANVSKIAIDVRKTLESTVHIQKANIFLDLNQITGSTAFIR